MSEHTYCVILAGGTGTRFWPVSREDKPKQFLAASDDGPSFLQATFKRMSGIIPQERILVASQERYKSLIKEQLPSLKEENMLLEPYGRNTGPALAFAAYVLLKRDPEAVMVVTPCDHIIGGIAKFRKTLSVAVEYATHHSALVTLGIFPTKPNANFGYVQVSGGAKGLASGVPVPAKTFTEKPSVDLAKVFIDSGEFLWNSGIFVWKAAVLREEMHVCCPEITRLWHGWQNVLETPAQKSFVERIYTDSPNISIDYAVMEKSDKVWVVPSDFRWSDVGTWDSMYDYAVNRNDPERNVTDTAGRRIVRDSTGNIIYSSAGKGRLTVVNGLHDFLVIDTPDVLLVCPRDDSRMQEAISYLGLPGYEEYK